MYTCFLRFRNKVLIAVMFGVNAACTHRVSEMRATTFSVARYFCNKARLFHWVYYYLYLILIMYIHQVTEGWLSLLNTSCLHCESASLGILVLMSKRRARTLTDYTMNIIP